MNGRAIFHVTQASRAGVPLAPRLRDASRLPDGDSPPRRVGAINGRQRRRGYTLVELVVVISVNTVLMAVGASLLGMLLRTEHQGRRHFDRIGALVRLADQWRSDVAASRVARVVPGAEIAASDPQVSADRPTGAASQAAPRNSVLRLEGGPDKKIEFFRDGDRLRRIEYQGPTAVRREAYIMTDLRDADFSVFEARIATLRLSFGDEKSAPGNIWQIDARLGWDGRFAGTEKTGEKP